MKFNRTFVFVLGGNFAVLLLMYLPYTFQRNLGLEIFVPAVYNIGLIIVDFVVALILTCIPSMHAQAKWWWLTFGIVLLMSIPACLATTALNEAIAH